MYRPILEKVPHTFFSSYKSTCGTALCMKPQDQNPLPQHAKFLNTQYQDPLTQHAKSLNIQYQDTLTQHAKSLNKQYQDSLTQHANSLNTQKAYRRRALSYVWQYYTNNGEIPL